MPVGKSASSVWRTIKNAKWEAEITAERPNPAIQNFFSEVCDDSNESVDTRDLGWGSLATGLCY